MNKLLIIGNLTANPESRIVDGRNGSFSVCNFNVAVNRVIKGDKSTQYFRVSCFGKAAENAMKYLFKGSKVAVSGPVHASAYEDRNGRAQASLEVTAEDIEYLSSKKDNGQQTEQQAPEPSPDEFMNVPDDMDELPFN